MLPEWDGIRLGNAAGPLCPDSGRGKIREQGMLGQQGPIKDQVDSLCSKESSNNMERHMEIQTGCFGWQKFQFEYSKLIRTFKNHSHPLNFLSKPP